MTRSKAVALHLGVSLGLAGPILGLLVWAWYPAPLLELEDGWQGARLAAMLVAVTGPTLTLVVFKPGKPGLAFDLGAIALLQAGAFAYGLWQLYDTRPVLVAHAADHFRPLSRALLAQWDGEGRLLRRWEGLRPRWVQVALPDDPVAFAELEAASRSRPGALHGLTGLYRPLAAAWPQALQDAVDIQAYVSLDPGMEQALQGFTVRLGRPVGELAFFPYIGRERRVFLAFDRQSGAVVGVLDIPYEPVLARPEVPRIERVGPGLAAAVD